jgi:hypothetical protein
MQLRLDEKVTCVTKPLRGNILYIASKVKYECRRYALTNWFIICKYCSLKICMSQGRAVGPVCPRSGPAFSSCPSMSIMGQRSKKSGLKVGHPVSVVWGPTLYNT